MFFKRGEVVDLWKEGLGQPHWMYYLYDPRDNSLCYVGITKQKFQSRLGQHRSPKKSNMASIAKLQRHLKSIGLTLQGEVVLKGSEELVSKFEKYMVTGYKMYAGKDSIKNHQIGGRDAFSCAPESKQKAWVTRNENLKSGKTTIIRGEDSASAKVTEKQVLEVYSLIKQFYTNSEILDKLSLPIGVTGLCAIRNGTNWRGLFIKEGMINIPSMNVVKGALNSQDKLKVLSLIEQGLDFKEIQKTYKVQTTDLARIKEKTLWKMAWKVYENYYKTK